MKATSRGAARLAAVPLLFFWAQALIAAQEFLPRTEQGNVLLREFDQLPKCASCRLYIGHTGILGGWQGNNPADPSDHTVYHQNSRQPEIHWVVKYLWAEDVTVVEVPFSSFTTHNYLVFDGAPHKSYGGGWTAPGWGWWFAPKLDPVLRQRIDDEAAALKGAYIYFFPQPFTKTPTADMFQDTGSFRCDGLVEYVYERAGVASGRGLFPSFLELAVPTPAGYVNDAASRESGQGPEILTFSTVALSGGGIRVTGTANDGAHGSGVKAIWAGYWVSASSFYILTSDLAEVDGTKTFDLTLTTNGIASASALVRVFDRAGNETVQSFTIKTTLPNLPQFKDQDGNPLSGTIKSTSCVTIVGSDSLPVVKTINFTNGAGFSSTWTAVEYSTEARLGGREFCNLAAGTYTATVCDFAGNCRSAQLVVETGTYQIALSSVNGQAADSVANTTLYAIGQSPLGFYACGAGASDCNSCIPMSLDNKIYMRMMWSMGSNTPVCLGSEGDAWPSGSTRCCTRASVEKARSTGFTITNTTDSASGTIVVYAYLDPPGPERVFVSSETSGIAAFGSMGGHVKVDQVGLSTPVSSPNGVVRFEAPYTGLNFTSPACGSGAPNAARRRQVKRQSGDCYDMSGSFAGFTSTASLTFQYTDASADTTTLRIYYFDGADWSSGAVTQQGVVKDTTTLVITATGAITHSGLYAAFFDGVDATAPETSFSIEGATSVFDGAVFASTDSYFVLTATDPAVAGYAAEVSTIYYRVDASSSDAFEIYESSFPLPMGRHSLEYRAQDYAGNLQSVQVSTVLVTIGAAARATNDLGVGGRLVVGLSTTGAGLDLEAGAVSNYALLISSPDGRTMLAVNNMGSIGLGEDPVLGRLSIASGGDAALQLRSGNSTGTPTSVQIALGYDGTAEMRHAIRTEHHASTTGNRMSFLLWTPAQSTPSLGAMELLSLWASTSSSKGLVHIRPVGSSTEELIVSNGATTGGGTIHRLQAAAPSSREGKQDIVYLTEADEERALAELLALKLVRFRYKRLDANGELVRDPAAPLRRGILYEQAPESLRSGASGVSIDERVANLELALKAELRQLRDLQARIRALKERKK